MSISQGQKITATDVNNHINNKNNPHGITPASIGAAESSHTHSGLYSPKHYWYKCTFNATYAKGSQINSRLNCMMGSAEGTFSFTIKYSDSCSYNYSTGTWSLVSPTTVTVTNSNYTTILSGITNKYFITSRGGGGFTSGDNTYPSFTANKIYYSTNLTLAKLNVTSYDRLYMSYQHAFNVTFSVALTNNTVISETSSSAHGANAWESNSRYEYIGSGSPDLEKTLLYFINLQGHKLTSP